MMLKINKGTILKTIFNVLIFSKIFFGLCSSADLKITEVFPYGKNERIEIYNNDKIAFSGDIEITGVKSQPLKLKNISINPGKTIIVGDSWIVKINDSQVLDKKGLSISDESAIDISIILDGVVLDNFKVLKQDIVSTDKKNSFEKVFLGLDIVVKSVNKYSSNNILPSIQANPGIVHILGHDENSPILQSNNIPQSNTKIDKSKIVKQTKTKSNLSTSSTKEDKLAEQNRILKEEIEQVREELSLTKTCLSLLSSKLKQNRNSIYYKDGFEKIDNFYTIQLLKLKDHRVSFNIFDGNKKDFKALFDSYQISNVEDLVYSLFSKLFDYYFMQTYNDFINLLSK